MMPGMIMLWYGEIADIPSGWKLCNGLFGTPDLTNRFVLGAGNTYDPNEIGGTFSHNHTFTGDGHSHNLEPGSYIEDVYPAGDFAHGTDSSPATGTTVLKSHFPSYRALCYIMKMPIP